MLDTNLSERTALVTGAGRGNGRAIATQLAEHGATVVVNDLEAEPAERTAEEIRDAGGDAIAVTADVSEAAEVEAMVETATADAGRIDVLVNNAGVGAAGPFLERDDNDRFELNLDVHFWGSLNCTDAVVDGMLEQGYGNIINITSIHTKNGVGMSPEYDVGKFSLLGLTKSLALELGREGVRVNAVAPGWVDTRMVEDFSERTTEQIRATSTRSVASRSRPKSLTPSRSSPLPPATTSTATNSASMAAKSLSTPGSTTTADRPSSTTAIAVARLAGDHCCRRRARRHVAWPPRVDPNPITAMTARILGRVTDVLAR